MFFKAVNKFTGAVDGWGKSKTLEDFCERYDMSQVDVEEISEEEINKLYEKVNSEEESCRAEIGTFETEDDISNFEEKEQKRFNSLKLTDEEEKSFKDMIAEEKNKIRALVMFAYGNINQPTKKIALTFDERIIIKNLLVDEYINCKREYFKLSSRYDCDIKRVDAGIPAKEAFWELGEFIGDNKKRLAEITCILEKFNED